VTPDQLSAIRARLDAADTDFRPDIDHVEEEFGFLAGVRVVTRMLPYDSGIGTEQDKDDKAHAFCDLMSHAKTDLRALLDEVERLTKREDELVKAGLDLMVANKDLTVERDAACQRTAEAFQRGVETFRRHMYAFALGATSYSRPSNESQLILDELPRMQVDDPEAK
jgi:hypothetical protein